MRNALSFSRLSRVLACALLLGGLAACGGTVGGPGAFQETEARARSAYEQTLAMFGLTGADISVGPTLCQPTSNIALHGLLAINTEPDEGLAIFMGIRDYWLEVPNAVEVQYLEPEGAGFHATRVAIDGGNSAQGGYELYADFDQEFDALAVEVTTGCYRP